MEEKIKPIRQNGFPLLIQITIVSLVIAHIKHNCFFLFLTFFLFFFLRKKLERNSDFTFRQITSVGAKLLIRF